LFLPTTLEEVKGLGWKSLDVILVTGDTYIDSPYSGMAMIGKTLLKAGYHVGVIAQPNVTDTADITRLGEPTLFWGVTGGTVDSMVANYTATLRKRRSDDFTPGGLNNRRPDRAVIVYANLIRRAFKGTVPIVLGGIEASLRRITHYDYWTDKLRAPILFDAKADYLLYGMAESSVVELANSVRDKRSPHEIRGLAYLAKEAPKDYLVLPSFEESVADADVFVNMFELFYQNNDPITARGIAQKKADRYYVQNPPALTLAESKLDELYTSDWERAQHPYYALQGDVKALETIQFSIPTHRGCYGECNFCAIAVHEGRTVSSRSEVSILDEAEQMTHHPAFKGIIRDIGGPTANMYQIECAKKIHSGACPDKRCIFPEICPVLKVNHTPQVSLLRKVRAIPGVRKVFVGSGIRYDMVMEDKACGMNYMKELVSHHVSGQLKVAPEHTDPYVLQMMGKPSAQSLNKFKQKFEEYSKEAGKAQFLTYYLIAAYPGCSDREMKKLKEYATKQLHVSPEQVQVFTPTPSTYASVMYYTEKDPFSGKPIFVEKDLKRKVIQKEIVVPPERSSPGTSNDRFAKRNIGYAKIQNNPRKRT
jgi:uncharacterized radical SAM protein YgiQ